MKTKTAALDPKMYRENPKMIAKYLNAALANEDPSLTMKAIGNLARVHGISNIAKQSSVSREGLYRSFRGDSDPAFGTVLRVLTALGMQLVVKPRTD